MDLTSELARAQALLQARAGETEVELRLDATRRACELLGDIHTSAPVITVTGTNGKTSTVRMVDTLIRAHDLRTGRFSSPHMQDLTERFSVDGEPVNAERFVEIVDDIQPVLYIVDQELAQSDRPPLTFFEALTVVAFAIFADAPVDVMILEVGMGGEWDSTNVADAQVCVFTPVSLDHQQFLGDTVEEIARTKAGILNRTVDPSPAPHPVAVVGPQVPEVEDVFASEFADRGVESRWLGREFGLQSRVNAVDGQVIHVRTQLEDYPDLFLPLHGEHQAVNATVALAAVEAFLGTEDKPLNVDVVGEGMSAVTSPGRIEILRSEPTVIVDGAHNAHAAQVLAETVGDAFDFAEVVAVVAMYADKDPHGVFEHLSRFARRVIVTQVQSPRAMGADELAHAASEWWEADDVLVENDMNSALMKALDLALDESGTGVVVTGSLSTVGEARTLLGRKEQS